MTASEADVLTLARIVSRDRPEPPGQGLSPSLLSELMDLQHCESVSFAGMDSRQQSYWFAQLVPAEDDAEDEVMYAAHWAHYWECEPCSYAERTGDLRSVTKPSDFYSARQWHSTGMYSDWFRPQGLDRMLTLCLPAPEQVTGPGRMARMMFFREPGPDFSERDRALLTLLRPHLQQAYLDAERRRHGTPQLTSRHWELLRLVAAGHTNSQIARRLGVAEGTVRKHLENIYGRLQVSNRTAAVTRAFPERAAV